MSVYEQYGWCNNTSVMFVCDFWQFQILSRAFYGLCINSIWCKTGGNYLALCYEYIPSAIFISPLNQLHAIAKKTSQMNHIIVYRRFISKLLYYHNIVKTRSLQYTYVQTFNTYE